MRTLGGGIWDLEGFSTVLEDGEILTNQCQVTVEERFSWKAFLIEEFLEKRSPNPCWDRSPCCFLIARLGSMFGLMSHPFSQSSSCH